MECWIEAGRRKFLEAVEPLNEQYLRRLFAELGVLLPEGTQAPWTWEGNTRRMGSAQRILTPNFAILREGLASSLRSVYLGRHVCQAQGLLGGGIRATVLWTIALPEVLID